MTSRALLVQIEAFVAENNIRRSVLLCATNTQNASDVVNDISAVLKSPAQTPADTLNFICATGNKATMIRTTGGPARITVTFSAQSPVTFTLDSIFLITSNIVSLVVHNDSTTVPISVRIIQI